MKFLPLLKRQNRVYNSLDGVREKLAGQIPTSERSCIAYPWERRNISDMCYEGNSWDLREKK